MIEEKIVAFRQAFKELPEEYKRREVIRLYNIVNGRKFIVLEDEDIGKVLKFANTGSLIEYLWANKHIKTTKSYIYRVLQGRHPLLHGYKIYYQEEEE
jgi:hypothetical protein